MSGFPRVRCHGAPRDLGLDQGAAFGAEIRALVARRGGGAFARMLATLRPPAAQRAVERDTYRYFPHMAERTAGFARGAKVPVLALAEISALPERAPADALRVVTGARGPALARALPPDALIALRESAPDTDYRSLELIALAHVAPLLGVNEHGLAVGAVLLGAPAGECSAPAALLAQDCLQRFDRVEKAVEWIERRRGGGCALIVLADTTGAAAAVEVEHAERRRVAPPELPLSGSTADRCCIAVADPASRSLAWTHADGATGEANLS
ncbi:MAG: hypothetical protein FJ091_13420 [Deltaproteobacteria bacterium]|nr:hypothetical protein [Deltaproteobacteria bacterium]